VIFTSFNFSGRERYFRLFYAIWTYHRNVVGPEAGGANLNHLRCPRERQHDDAQGNITTVSVETRTLGAKRSSWTTAVLCWPDHDLHAVSLVPGQGQGLGTCICNWHHVRLLLQL
jgi:hypothetical protein